MSETVRDSSVDEAGENSEPYSAGEVLRAIEVVAAESWTRAARINRRLLYRLWIHLAQVFLVGGVPFYYSFFTGFYGSGWWAVLWLALVFAGSYIFTREDFEEIFWRRENNRDIQRKLVEVYTSAQTLRVERPLCIDAEEADALWKECAWLESEVRRWEV